MYLFSRREITTITLLPSSSTCSLYNNLYTFTILIFTITTTTINIFDTILSFTKNARFVLTFRLQLSPLLLRHFFYHAST